MVMCVFFFSSGGGSDERKNVVMFRLSPAAQEAWVIIDGDAKGKGTHIIHLERGGGRGARTFPCHESEVRAWILLRDVEELRRLRQLRNRVGRS
jgi:hypothetical protein